MTKLRNNNKPNNNNHLNRNAKNAKINQKQSTYDLKCHTIQQLYDLAEQFYAELKNQAKNDRWNEFISQKGTKKDKITFVAAEILKKPEASLEHIEMLAKWTLDVNHNFALPACQALSNIYISHVFVQKPSLRVFLDSVQEYIKSNKKDSNVRKGDLIGFYLQHHIKHYYGQLIRGLTELLTSTVTHIKKTAIQILASLSRFKELRRTILSTLINKFGDSDMEVVNDVSKSLKAQIYEDIQASETLLEESEAFLFRQHLSQKSQFYVINFLNNVNLKYFSEKSLTKLFELFFHFFNKLMQVETEEKSISSRLFLNSIKGLNKIFAFMKTSNKQTMTAIEAKVELVYKTFHKTQNTKAKVQLLLFLFQSCTHLKGSISDRFYRILYEFLNTNEILHCSISEMFFDLLLLSLKEDQNMNRTLAFIKRILQLCFEAQSNFIVTCLILVNKVIMEKQPIQIMMRQKQNILEETEQTQQTNPDDEKVLPYDMNKRQPLFAGAQKTNIWELSALKNHYHPTVRKFTQHILKNEVIPYEGSNPLLELSLTSFVEKMSLRKQKKSDSWKLKVKRNLQKIRTSKYESMLEKPLESFKQNEQFIRKYLQKRQSIHKNKMAMQPEDIQDFADQVIEKQMDRLNPKQDGFDDLSLSKEQFDEDQEFPEDGEQIQDYDGQVPEEDLGNDEDLEGEEDFQAHEFGDDQDMEADGQDYQDQEFGDDQDNEFDEMDGYDEQAIGSEELDKEESDMGDGDKEFEDVFDDIGDSPQYPKKKKSINKQHKQHKFKPKTNPKNQAYKQKKRQFKSEGKKNNRRK